MPTLPKSLAAARSAVVSTLMSSEHTSILYSAMDTIDTMRPVRTARNEAGVFLIDSFSSMEVAKRAVVRWEVAMDDHARAGLVQFLAKIVGGVHLNDCRWLLSSCSNLATNLLPRSTACWRKGQGKLALPSNGLILMQTLRDNLLPSDDKENEMRAQKEFIVAGYGPTQCWVPVGTEVLAKHQLTRLRQQAKVASQ